MLPNIRFSNMLEAMEKFDSEGNPVVFELKYIGFNRLFLAKIKRKIAEKGDEKLEEIIEELLKSDLTEKTGKVIHIKNSCLARNMKGIVNSAARRETIVTARSTIPDRKLRFSTRKLFVVDTMQIKTCYLRLIIEFNGHPVIY